MAIVIEYATTQNVSTYQGVNPLGRKVRLHEDALQVGYQKFGLSPFLVKEIQGVERVQSFTRDIFPCRSST